ncbi:MAG TPA: transglycosylase SLT domain-containing protein [Pyrinomonadaceae bacterium]|jgi:membrane-bound lytic murein transglycosylase D|nr:transglycosylase SLT domain-containing protein [Pyrinomonadaceae bacterium]
MKSQRMLLFLLAIIISLTTVTRESCAQTAQSNKLYQGMTQAERAAFVAEQSRRIARQMSGTEYEFTQAFEMDIQKAVDQYTRRIGNNGSDRLWKGDARFVFERGQTNAPTLISVFKAHNVSPLIGLYIPLIESEYMNIQEPNSHGALGMFQFLPKTGERYGLTAQELLDVEKSADAAARYITHNLDQFKDDPMKEALALLAYNRGEQKTARDLQSILNDHNRRCSICALTASRDKLDDTFQHENAFYVPRFFAAAIIGENPQAFGLQLQPLSSYETKR